MSDLKYILGHMRPPFLILSPACVLTGWAIAGWRVEEISVLYLILAFVGAMTALIGMNTLNEYFDFKSGLDQKAVRTPFSGGSGTLPQNPEKAKYALITGLVALGITALIGLYFTSVWGLMILPLGILGLFVIVAYTPLLSRNSFICLLTPGIGFGILIALGTDFVLTGSYSWAGIRDE